MECVVSLYLKPKHAEVSHSTQLSDKNLANNKSQISEVTLKKQLVWQITAKLVKLYCFWAIYPKLGQ